MEEAIKLMRRHLSDRSFVYVFPSEITAAQIRKSLLSADDGKILPGTKCISWDRFKEETLSYAREGRAVNDAARAFFLTALLSDNADNPFFQTIIRKEYASSSLAARISLQRTLPLLKKIVETLGKTSRGVSLEKYQDFVLLFGAYTRFLSEAGFFEPEFETPTFSGRGKKYIIFYPEVISDFADTVPFLRDSPDVHFFSIQELGQKKEKRLMAFSVVTEELSWLMNALHKLLENGIKPSDIVISAAGLAELAPLLEANAALYDIRLVRGEGKPLIAYPGVNFLGHIAGVVSSNWNLAQLETLLFNRSVPWKETLPISSLIQFAYLYNCVRNFKNDTGLIDVWEFNFKRLVEAGESAPANLAALRVFYRSLHTSITAIAGAKTWQALKKAVTRFTAEFFDMTLFGEWENKYLQYAFRILDELAATEKIIPLKKISAPFSFWLTFLETTQYVAPRPNQGIAVYPYRVAAGTMSAYHFIINASGEETHTAARLFPFLSIDEEARLGLAEQDTSEAFLSLYLSSGENVSVSYSRQGLRKRQLPPPAFLKPGVRIESVDLTSLHTTDSYRCENRFFRETDADLPPFLFSPQKIGLREAVAVRWAPQQADFTTAAIPDPALRSHVHSALTGKEGIFVISPSDLEIFQSCPFRFLLEKSVRLSELPWSFTQDDNRWFGTFFHEVLHEFFRNRVSQDGSFQREKIHQYKKEMESGLAALRSVWENEKPIPILPLWQTLAEKIREGLDAFLEVTLETFDGFSILGSEKSYSVSDDGQGLILCGKIDLVGEKNDGMLLIDYKTNRTPLKSELAGETREPCSFQIPFYIMLIEAAGGITHAASYYSFQQKRYEHVVNPEAKKSLFSAEEMKDIISLMKEKINIMFERINAGDFTIGKRVEKACSSCPLRSVCRNKYYLRF